MWFRLALLLVLWLLLYRFILQVFRLLFGKGRSDQRQESKPRSGPSKPESTAWSPSDVIDVHYREVDPGESPGGDAHETESGEPRRQSR